MALERLAFPPEQGDPAGLSHYPAHAPQGRPRKLALHHPSTLRSNPLYLSVHPIATHRSGASAEGEGMVANPLWVFMGVIFGCIYEYLWVCPGAVMRIYGCGWARAKEGRAFPGLKNADWGTRQEATGAPGDFLSGAGIHLSWELIERKGTD